MGHQNGTHRPRFIETTRSPTPACHLKSHPSHSFLNPHLPACAPAPRRSASLLHRRCLALFPRQRAAMRYSSLLPLAVAAGASASPSVHSFQSRANIVSDDSKLADSYDFVIAGGGLAGAFWRGQVPIITLSAGPKASFSLLASLRTQTPRCSFWRPALLATMWQIRSVSSSFPTRVGVRQC